MCDVLIPAQISYAWINKVHLLTYLLTYLLIDGKIVSIVDSYKYLGLKIDSKTKLEQSRS